MLKVGLTGSIGSGKTMVATIFGKMGIPVYHADVEAKKFLLQDNVVKELVELFGKAFFDKTGNVDRTLLGDLVFNDISALDKLNKLIHPLVKADFDAWLLKHSKFCYVIHEAAILFESGFNLYFDKVITVDAPLELCISRVINRDKISREQVVSRMQNQWEPKTKASLADYLIMNDEQSMLIPQVLEVHKLLIGTIIS
ncbi:MAG: dephospho-CoA kinase [Bacteroidales bacterium]